MKTMAHPRLAERERPYLRYRRHPMRDVKFALVLALICFVMAGLTGHVKGLLDAVGKAQAPYSDPGRPLEVQKLLDEKRLKAIEQEKAKRDRLHL